MESNLSKYLKNNPDALDTYWCGGACVDADGFTARI